MPQVQFPEEGHHSKNRLKHFSRAANLFEGDLEDIVAMSPKQQQRKEGGAMANVIDAIKRGAGPSHLNK